MPDARPNILYVMTDQQRFDTIAALGNDRIHTPNLDRLVRRGLSLTNAYSTCPVCVPARYTIRTGCEPPRTRLWENCHPIQSPDENHPTGLLERTGPYLAHTMKQRGYRTFGIGKFHTAPVHEDLGYETHLHSEELYGSWETRMKDAYARFIHHEHPEYRHLELLHGERGEMYFAPQAGALPPELTVEAWAAAHAVEQIGADDPRPYFGFVSFVGPHPPLAPPIPFNRLYDPDRMESPLRGETEVDHADPFIPAHARAMFADDLSDHTWRLNKARYYGEITYIDQCLGTLLDAVEARPDADNTLICFFSDHGEMLGDHRACQKANFFEEACRVPFLVSWPARLPGGQRREMLAGLADLFALATGASGQTETRDGTDLLGALTGTAPPRAFLFGYCGFPQNNRLRAMVRWERWKFIFIQNGGRELLFDLEADPRESRNLAGARSDIAAFLRQKAAGDLRGYQATDALTADGADLRTAAFEPESDRRTYQFDRSRGITSFPDSPEAIAEVLRSCQKQD